MRTAIIVIVAGAVFSGCATPPVSRAIDNSRTFSKAFDPVWEDIVAFFAKNNIQVKNIAKDSGVIYAEASSFDANAADCGNPGMWRPIGRRANFNVFVSRSGSGPMVSVNTEYIETRRGFGDAIANERCISTSALEQAILNAIRP